VTRLAAILAPVLASAALLLPAASPAATQIGDPCLANDGIDGLTVFASAAPSSPLPLTSPVAGVITHWTVNVVPTPGTLPQILKVMRLTGPSSAQTVAEGQPFGVTGGSNQVSGRIPIAAGDRLGLFGPSEIGSLVCENSGTVEDRLGFVVGSAPVTLSSPFAEIANFRLPVVATIEPDADGDGYGDESQDGCPQSASFQLACPSVSLDALAETRRRSAVVYVATSVSAPVRVAGVVKLGKGAKATMSTGAKMISPGRLVRFTLRYPRKLLGALEALPANRELTLRLTASATNLAGQLSTDELRVKLTGQG
jgi:hypothetical protein